MFQPHWRPGKLAEYIGQKPLMNLLAIEIANSKRHHRPVEHLLFTGYGGLGKTTVAEVIAHERGSPPPVVLTGASVTHESLSEVLLGLDTTGYSRKGVLEHPELAKFPVLVIDEVQNMKQPLFELLHHVLEPRPDGVCVFQAKVKHGGVTTTRDVWVPACTFIWLSNYLGELLEMSRATVSRFHVHEFQFYSDEEIQQVLRQFAPKLDLKLTPEAAALLAARSDGVPRTAVKLLKRANTYVPFGSREVDLDTVHRTLTALEIDAQGMTPQMTKFLQILAGHGGGRLGIKAIASIMFTQPKTLEEEVEPLLMRRGLIQRGTGGRMVTAAGLAAIGWQDATNPLMTHAL